MHHWLPRAAARHPERVAIQTPDARVSYAELERRAREAAGALTAEAIVPGDLVALALRADEEFAVALHGCMLAGVVAVPIDLRLSERERAARGEATRSVEWPLRGELLCSPAAPRPEAIATVMHTSGTTACPRAVPLSYGNWLASALGSAVALGLDEQERWLCPLPLAHVGGLSILMRSVVYATTAVLHERFDSEAVLGALMDAAERITLVSLVPTMLARLLDAGLSRPPTLRRVLLGGGPIAPSLLERAAAAGVPISPTYGMTEACSQIATDGWPLPGTEVREGRDGELLVRGPTVAEDALGADGWLHTGDLGAIDERGRLTVTGRKSEVIVTGGENVSPGEVEAAIMEHPAIADAGVFSRPHRDWGEAVVATVVLRDGCAVSPEELRAHCGARVAQFKVPKEVRFAQQLPRSETGKLLRSELQAAP